MGAQAFVSRGKNQVEAFLSYSSKDHFYVDIVAKRLGPSRAIVDSIRFEEGMLTREEIDRNLSACDIFVVFLSQGSVDSRWVQEELTSAYERHGRGAIRKIYPIIIDASLLHTDDRIPVWLREEYNLRLISRPFVAARRIEQRLREVDIQAHGVDRFFVGRNTEIKSIEERLDSIDEAPPVCLMPWGLPGIGRRSLLRNALQKASVFADSYKPLLIDLDGSESIEDFILKVYDLGINRERDLTNLMNTTVEDKVDIAASLLQEVVDAREVLFVEDNRGIVVHSNIAPWFKMLLAKISDLQRVVLGVACASRPNPTELRAFPAAFSVHVPELTQVERTGLLKRLCEDRNLELTSQQLSLFASLFTGYPDQVVYAVQLISEEGVVQAAKNSEAIREYATNKVAQIFQRYADDENAMRIVGILTEMEFVSLVTLSEMLGDLSDLDELVGEFISSGVCEYLGATKEYVRLNETVRAYASRERVGIHEHDRARLEALIRSAVTDYDDLDVSELFYVIRESLIRDLPVDAKHIIPSHFLKAMRDRYGERRYNVVVTLADRVLLDAEYMDKNIVLEIRYYLCRSLAHLRDERFFKEIAFIAGAEHAYLMGYYYRINGRFDPAIIRFKEALKLNPRYSRARRELISVYLMMNDFEAAEGDARLNYERGPENVFHIHALVRCLIHTGGDEQEIDGLLRELSHPRHRERGYERFLTAKAEHLAVQRRELEAVACAREAVAKFPSGIWPRVALFDVCERFGDRDGMKTALEGLDESKLDPYLRNSVTLRRAVLAARSGSLQRAHDLVKRLSGYPADSLERLRGWVFGSRESAD